MVDALQDHLILEGEHTEGQAAIFRRANSEVSRERTSVFSCFKCGKNGHRASECWAAKGGGSITKPPASGGGTFPKVTCYTCGEVGHKSPQCMKGIKIEKNVSKDVKPKPVRRVWRNHPTDVQLSGRVNGMDVAVLLDSGATISVVPESMVTKAQLTGSTVAVKPFGATKPLLLPTAKVPFHIGSLEWEEQVAVAPWEQGVESEVLYSLNLKSQRGLELVLLANKIEQREVLRVTTRAQAKENSQREEEARVIAAENPSITPLPNQTNPVDESCTIPTVAKTVEEKVVVGSKSTAVERDRPVDGLEVQSQLADAQGTGKRKLTEDRPAEGVPEPVVSAATLCWVERLSA